jgi:hypothetical protein
MILLKRRTNQMIPKRAWTINSPVAACSHSQLAW